MRSVLLHRDNLAEAGFFPIYISLYGSQNYLLNDENSDVDTKAMVLPSLETLSFSNPISTTFTHSNGDQTDVKDVRIMFNNYKKQSINYIETLFTEYFWCSDEYKAEIAELRGMAEYIARMNQGKTIKAVFGMAMQKYSALNNEIKSYTPKDLQYIVRLREFMERYIGGEKFSSCLVSNHIEYLTRIKKGEFSFEAAKEIAATEIKKMTMLKEKFESTPAARHTDERAQEKLDSLLLCIMKKHLNTL